MENQQNSTNINWYPGHMAKTRRQIEEDLKIVDIVIELLDARIPKSSQNPNIKELTSKKKKIIVLNKCDLADEKQNQKWISYFAKKGQVAVLTDSNSGKGIDNCIKQIEKIMEEELKNDLGYLSKELEANEALNQIRLITVMQSDPKSIYRRIPELNGLMDKVREGHGRLLDGKRAELLEIIRQCMAEVHIISDGNRDCAELVKKADTYFDQQKTKINELQSLALLDGLVPQIWSYKDDICERIETAKQPPVIAEEKVAYGEKKTVPKKVIKTVYRQMAFPAKMLESQADIDAYVERMRRYLTDMLRDCDGIKLN